MQIVRELMDGPATCVVLEESAAPGPAGRRFVPLLQVVEAEQILSEPGSGQVLDCMVDDKPVYVWWEVAREPPHRLLVLTMVGPKEGIRGVPLLLR